MSDRYAFFLLRLIVVLWVFLLGPTRVVPAQPADLNFDAQAPGNSGSPTTAYGDFTFSGNGGTSIAIVTDGDLAGGADRALRWDANFAVNVTQVSFRSTDGTDFDVNSVAISRGLGENQITVRGYRDNVEQYTAVLDLDTNGSSNGGATFSGVWFGTLAFTGWTVDEVRFEETISRGKYLDLDIDDIDVSPTTLPVEFVRFDAVADDGTVRLLWETASETNNAGFEVQHQQVQHYRVAPLEGQPWQVLDFVAGQGTTLQAQRYHVRTPALAAGTHRFRLKQLDYDGAFAYSPEVEVVLAAPGTPTLTAYPNPFTGQTGVVLSLHQRQDITVTVYDALGRRIALLHEGPLDAGVSYRFEVQGQALPSGLYMIRAEGERFRATHLLRRLK